jgi:hypothetical protein
MEALEAYVLPSSRLANEAAGTTIRFIQASASPPLPRWAVNFAVECTSQSGTRRWLHPPNYTFRSMPRSQSANATALSVDSVREIRPRGRAKKEPKRLGKRVVKKTDGRYLIYFEKG